MEIIPVLNDDMELTHYKCDKALAGLSNHFMINECNDLFYITETISKGIDEVYKCTYKIDKELVKELYKVIKGGI